MKEKKYEPKVESCYFCKSRNFIKHSEATYWNEYTLNFVECANCRLIFTNPMPDFNAVLNGNISLQKFHTSRGTISQYRTGKEFTMFLRKIKKTGLLLDIGSAEGFFLLGVKDNSNWEVEGLEIIENMVEFSKNVLGLDVHFGTLETLDNLDKKFDVLRMNNIIEHVQDPIKFLKKAFDQLKTNGLVYCSTPNGIQDGYFLKTANKRGIKINLLENHFFYYPPKTLKEMFKSCGFKIIKSFCYDISHSLNDFGLLPWFKYPKETQNYNFDTFSNKINTELKIDKETIRKIQDDDSLKNWRIFFNYLKKEAFRIKISSVFTIGHQQLIIAQKI